jgi:hypothetical protein
MPIDIYNRKAAIEYARQWALSRNPRYYDFDSLGGDCTNFISQCLYAGSGVMNYKPTLGWYYISSSNRSPSWTGVPFLYNFLTRKTGVGPIGKEVSMEKVRPGDVSQFAGETDRFSHSQFIVSVGKIPALDNILICTHTYDSLDKPLSSYEYKKIRFIHIEGVMK